MRKINFKEEFRKEKLIIERTLGNILPSPKQAPQELHMAMRYAVLCGGKRIRPILVLLSAEAINKPNKDCLWCACAIELIHNYSLVHDDLPGMDNDDTRRGKLSVHKKFSEYNAILCGNALLTRAFELLSRVDRTKLRSIFSEIDKAIGSFGILGGQLDDVKLAKKGQKKIFLKTLISISNRKTAVLIKAASKIGALCVTSDKKKIKALEAYGEKIGLAFQVIDDILDKEGFWAACGREKAIELAYKLIKEANQKIKIFGRKAKRLYLFSDYLLGRIN